MYKKLILGIAAALPLVLLAQQPLALKHGGHEAWVAASDSHPADKAQADIVCDGTDDQADLQRAVDAIGLCGTVRLAAGNYRIDAFSRGEHGVDCAVSTRLNSKITITGAARANGTVDIDAPLVNGTRLIVTRKCYNALDTARQYAVLGGCDNAGFDEVMSQELTVRQLAIVLPDNQKPIIGIDGYHLGALNIDGARISTRYFNRGMSPDQTFRVGNERCIGVRGLQGSNNGSETIFRSIYAIGLGVGFDLSGEHLVCEQLGAIGNRYGYRFNGFKHEVGVWCHPITLINCCDEVSANYPYFGRNDYGQAVNLINFNIEHYPNMFSLGGDYAREAVPGQWRGNIDYDIQDWENNIANSPYRRFWAAGGNGSGTVSRNNAHAPAMTTVQRRAFAPCVGQTVIDTDLGRPVTCLQPGDYAVVKLAIDGTATAAGRLVITVGRNTRAVEIPGKMDSVEQLVDYLYRHLYATTSCKPASGGKALLVYNQAMGELEASGVSVDCGATGIKATASIARQGKPNQWIAADGTPCN